MKITKNSILNMTTAQVIQTIFTDNVDRGWYDGFLGKDHEDRVVTLGAKEMLIVSELAEACEGVRKGLDDDHLPQYPMESVEMADVIIRLLDLMGFISHEYHVECVPTYSNFSKKHQAVGTSNEYDTYRDLSENDKGDPRIKLARLGMITQILFKGSFYVTTPERFSIMKIYTYSSVFAACMEYCRDYNIDIFPIIVDKLDYNANRADHKRENRSKEGGKKV